MRKKIAHHISHFFQGAFVPLTGANPGVQLAPFLSEFTSGNIASFVNATFKAAIALGAMLAVLRIAYGGFVYMSTDIWPAKRKAKDILQDAILGLLLLLSLWLILNQINPQILNLNILQDLSSPPTVSTTSILPSSSGPTPSAPTITTRRPTTLAPNESIVLSGANSRPTGSYCTQQSDSSYYCAGSQSLCELRSSSPIDCAAPIPDTNLLPTVTSPTN